MALATQCPHCYTSFRVANDQLKLHAGMVRCGACKLTFNGIEHLLAPGEAPRTAAKVATAEIVETAEATEATEATEAISKTPGDLPDNPTNFSDRSNQTDELPASIEAASAPDPEFDTILKNESIADDELSLPTPSVAAVSEDQNPEPISEFSEIGSKDTDTLDGRGQAFNVETTLDIPSTASSRADLTYESDGSESDESAVANQEASSNDSMVVTEDDIDAFDQMFKLTSSSDQSIDAQPATNVNQANQEAQASLMQQFSAHLETIEPALGVPPEKEKTKRQAPGLTEKLEFELTSEEQALVEQAELLHQLELENRAAILDDDAKEWSRHESSFNEKAPEEPSFSDQAAIEDPLFPKQSPSKPVNAESTESHTESSLLSDDENDVTPGFVLLAEKKRRYGKWQTFGWSLSCLILLMAIVLQSTYFFRSAIAAEWPATKPHLLRACQLLACQIKLPAQRHMLELAGSELLILNEELRINTLAFQIQNKSNTAQEWPALELTLKDLRGKTVLQKVFKPSEYLINKADLAKGIAARSESNHKLHFELNILKASNYEVGIFYP